MKVTLEYAVPKDLYVMAGRGIATICTDDAHVMTVPAMLHALADTMEREIQAKFKTKADRAAERVAERRERAAERLEHRLSRDAF